MPYRIGRWESDPVRALAECPIKTLFVIHPSHCKVFSGACHGIKLASASECRFNWQISGRGASAGGTRPPPPHTSPTQFEINFTSSPIGLRLCVHYDAYEILFGANKVIDDKSNANAFAHALKSLVGGADAVASRAGARTATAATHAGDKHERWAVHGREWAPRRRRTS
ncbi:hypothetical protein EVAR_53751_1 [Eumeta japonica]|uniref:Uncharacterized protein n=1 Tax=Eumeta variegata TaxID=151549 RepID=A0A4C1ZFX8_EUMVA|nr:hypothetical protein EVAR_53751_1 [Eumeta japonica]